MLHNILQLWRNCSVYTHTQKKRYRERNKDRDGSIEIYVPRFYIILLFSPKENRLVYGEC